jgi:hypothetical protein
LEQEGLFVKRIERGIDEIQTEKDRYLALANFGHSGSAAVRPGHEWPVDSATLLARCVNEMQRRLRPVRDCAAYRIIDMTNSIMKAIAEEELSKERSPWEQIGPAEGISALCSFLDIAELMPVDLQKEPKGLAAFGHLDPADVALRFTSLFDSLVRAISDLARLADDMAVPDTGGLSYILEEVLQATLYVQEDLLVVLDDASEDSLQTWLSKSWGALGGSVASAATSLEKAVSSMPLKGDSTLAPQVRIARRSKLALMRGLQVLLNDSRFRVLLLEEAANPQEASARAAAKQLASDIVSTNSVGSSALKDVMEVVDFEPFYRTRSQTPVPASPRNGYIPRKPEKEKHNNNEDVATVPSSAEAAELSLAEIEEGEVIPPALKAQTDVASPTRKQSKLEKHSRLRGSSTPAVQRDKEAHDLAYPDSPASSTMSMGAVSLSQKAMPSWLNPPWPRPRQDVAFDSWSRPCTPSTVCDEADFLISPKSKFIDGQCVSLRLGSTSKRLPPITSGAGAALPGGMRKAWQM